MNNANPNTAATDILDDLDADIAAMIAEEAGDNEPVVAMEEEVIEIEGDVVATDEDLDAIDTELRIDDARAAVYAESDSAETLEGEVAEGEVAEGEVAEDESEDADTPTPASTVTPITRSRKARTPGVGRNTKPSEALPKVVGGPLHKAAMVTVGVEHTDSSLDALMSTLDALAQKVRTKAINLVRFRNDASKLEPYTRIGLKHLAEKLAKGDTAVTSAELFTVLRANPYSEGTARAQSNQLMQLFPALGVVKRTGRGSLTITGDSAILADFVAQA